jgi:hypothetical protein
MAPQPVLSLRRSAARPERRMHSRLAINREVCLLWHDRQGDHALRARAVDVSKHGMLAEGERAIEPGTVVSIQTASMMLRSACVRHCTLNGSKYRIGMHVPDRMTTLLTSTHHAF